VRWRSLSHIVWAFWPFRRVGAAFAFASVFIVAPDFAFAFGAERAGMPTAFDVVFDAALDHAKFTEGQNFERLRIRPRLDALALPPDNKQITSGEQRLLKFEDRLLNGYQWKTHHFEKLFMDQLIRACAELVVGNDWSVCGARIMHERGWDYRCKMVMGSAPRRWGKVSISLFNICLDANKKC
jgi:hypothetical protein